MSNKKETFHLLDALCYIDGAEWSVHHPLHTSMTTAVSETIDIESFSSAASPEQEAYRQLQVQVLQRQIQHMIEEEMKSNDENKNLHPQTCPDYSPSFHYSELGLGEHFNKMMEKEEFIPFLNADEKEQFLENIKRHEPLYYYQTLVNMELTKAFGEDTLRKTIENYQKQIKVLEREKSALLHEIESVNKKRKREQFDIKHEFDRLTEKNTQTSELIFRLQRACSELAALNKKIKQNRQLPTTPEATTAE
ncbi:hypothetical protein C9374_011727 [Naegleria lovaniensis]|uniref:Uncharacterized protein n=1 Tax=Naegleria lovaniensis TaxID=51637 RepID=A0AA88GDZ5_NAELO|nr:uncharacterized protein C9374_011727 [Naegleria lovaniensis]KAG2373842.1 hypothetical protein C9374_011727 [Naegleria lovaniensis]